MAVRVKHLWLWPDGGRVGHPWVDGSVGGDALARAGVVVKVQLKPLLAEHEVRLRASIVQVFVEEEPASGSELELTILDDFDGVYEAALLAVPPTVAGLTVEQRWWLAFDVIEKACRGLQEAAGADLDADPWPAIRSQILSKGPAERVVTAWKSAPDRRHRARLVTQVRADHPDETWIEIAAGKDEKPLGRGPTVVAPLPPRGLEPPRWQSSVTARAEVLVDRGGPVLQYEELIAKVGSLVPVEPSIGGQLQIEPELPAIKVMHFSVTDPSRPPTVEIGSVNGEPWLLSKEHLLAWASVTASRQPQVEQWWAASGLATLHLSAVTMTGATRTSASRDGRDLWVEVALEPGQVAPLPPEVAVLTALQKAIARAAQRAKTPPLSLT